MADLVGGFDKWRCWGVEVLKALFGDSGDGRNRREWLMVDVRVGSWVAGEGLHL